MANIDGNDIFAQVEPRAVTEAPDGYIIDQPETGKVHFLNPTAVLVYEACDGKRSVEEIEALVQQTFDLPEPPTKPIRDCLANLLAEKLLTLCTPSSSEP